MSGKRAEVEDRVLREWGFELPESIFRFWAFVESLGPVERRALTDMEVSVAGVSDVFAEPGVRPRDGVDDRTAGARLGGPHRCEAARAPWG
ncbi:hypothetical protein [Streptomyces sp. NPDC005322]|uniref:hypothetical protein n=1 Tax=Streptomyces sp. NPDC005322 TaxID=3157032 RepID=UPI0033B329C9